MTTDEIANIIAQISGCSECDVDDMNVWLQCDSADEGCQIMSDKIVKIVESFMGESQSAAEEDNDKIGGETEDETVPTYGEAFTRFKNALKWMDQQPECDPVQLLSVKRLRDLAARNGVSTLEQQTLFDIFK